MYSFAQRIRRVPPGFFRRLATVAPSKRQTKDGGTISDIFTTLKPGEEQAALPDRFSTLKKDIFKDELVESWRQVLAELEGTVAEITEKGNNVCLRHLFLLVHSNAVFMLHDYTNTRHIEVATLLWALARGISSLRLLVSKPLEIEFSHSTPRTYRTCTLIQPQDEMGELTFESKLGRVDQQVFFATLNSSSYLDIRVSVKLVSGPYSQAVHLAAHGLAPKLYSTVKVDGAPTAYIMEYLDPSAWKTLHQFLMSNAAALSHGPLEKALRNIVDRLKYVHGDLRTNNIMIRKDSPRESLDLRVVDFDWAGKKDQVCYPADRNTNIKWLGKAGGLIEDGHDWELVSSWLFAKDSQKAKTRGRKAEEGL